MSLCRRGNVWWTYVWMKGVRHGKSTGTSNLKNARLIDQQFKEELNLQRHAIRPPRPEMPFAELAALCIAEGVAKPWVVGNLKVLLPYFGETPIGQFHKGLAREFRRFRHSQKTITEITVNRNLEALRHIFFWAVDEGYLVVNPLKNIPLVRERRKPRPVMTVEEETLLLPKAAPHLRAIVITALDTGMRRGEILNQRWEHVDLTRGLLAVTKSKTAQGEGREIPLTHRLFDLLAPLAKPEGLVFLYRGQAVRTPKTAWKAAIRRAGIRYLRFHDLRHTFNTRLMEAGVISDIRKALMGHSSGDDVHSTYTHVELPAKREAVRKLEAWVNQQHLENQSKGGRNDRTESSRAILGQTISTGPSSTEAVEEKVPGGSGARPN